MLNALILTFCGFTSNLITGIIGDKFEKRNNYKNKGAITAFSSLLPVPFICAALSGLLSFYPSMICMSLFVLLSGGYHATAVTMLENVAKTPEQTENMVSAWNLYTGIFHGLSPIVFGILAALFNARTNPLVYGKLLIGFIVGGYIPASFLFWRSGKAYNKEMEER